MAEPLEYVPESASDVFVIDPDGRRGTISKSDLPAALKRGWRLESQAATKDATQEQEFGDSPGTAFVQGVGRSVTLGGTDVLLNALGQGEDADQYRKRNAPAAFGGELTGALLPIGGGAIAASAGRAAERELVGVATTRAGKYGGAAVRGAIEGEIFGAQAGVTEIALSDKPFDWENAAVTMGTNVLAGSAIGGVAGAGGRLLEESVTASRSYAARTLEKIKTPDSVPRGDFPEVASLDRKATSAAIVERNEVVRVGRIKSIDDADAAIKVENTRLAADRDVFAAEVHAEAVAFRDFASDPKNFISSSDVNVRGVLRQSGGKPFKASVDNGMKFVEQRGSAGARDILQKQQGALKTVLADADAVIASEGIERQAILDALPTRSKLPKFDDLAPPDLPPDAPFRVTAKELERAGLYELPGAGVVTARMARVKAGMGTPEAWDQPIRLTMDSKGRMFIDDGRHRIRAALDEGGARKFDVQIERGSAGWDATLDAVQLGRSSVGGNYLTPEQSRLYAEFAGLEIPRVGKGKAAPKALTITDDELSAFREAIELGEVAPPALKRVLVAQEMLEKNQALLGKMDALKKPLESDALAAITKQRELVKDGLVKDDMLEALKAHARDIAEDSFGKKLARGAGGLGGGGAGFAVGGPLGAAAGGMAGQDAAARLYDRLIRKIRSGGDARKTSMKASIAMMFAKGAEKAAKKTVPVASKVLPALTYARKDYVDGVMGPERPGKSKDAMVNDFRARARELDAVTERTPEGGMTVRMRARGDLHGRLAALWDINPDAANAIEMTHNKRLEFLATKMPRNAAPPHLRIGPDTWEPSKAQLAKFARYMDAVERPESVLERMAVGTLTPEDAEVMKTVYPAMYEDARSQIMDRLAEVQTSLPYQKRLALSIYLDVPVDPAVTSEALGVYQGLYQQEQAQQPGGMPGKKAPSKFTASSEKPTRAQRAGE